MERILYYVVEPQLDCIDGFRESNGWKTVTVYTIEENVPKQFFEIECGYSDNSLEKIQEYLDDNGYGDETFKMIPL